MALFDIIMPKMGESIEEATITKWFVKEGDKVVEDDVLLEIATDKVDSEIPSPVEGIIKKILFSQDDTIAVGTVIAVIDMDGSEEDVAEEDSSVDVASAPVIELAEESVEGNDKMSSEDASAIVLKAETVQSKSDRFYSPLVKKIAKEENISQDELDSITGSGQNGRVNKNDILAFLQNRTPGKPAVQKAVIETKQTVAPAPTPVSVPVQTKEGDEVIEMSRLRKLIAGHMIHSKQTSAHVTNMLEIDVSNVVKWRTRMKDEFLDKEGEKLTYLPVFLEATVKTLRDYPMINSSVDGDKIIVKRDINLGIAVSLEGNNLIVPNIKNADNLNLTGITKQLNGLARAARSNKLNPDDISGGTFTVTNFGSFKNDIGTPIINQPEVAILAIGAIKKKPAVIETSEGDMIAIRQKMWLSLTYDHRIIDGALGGAFLKTLGDYIESFDLSRTI
jgi:2-oxoglutarate dehydrogenase E2 component (dihydrolipoamide succinyltransferase)